MVKTLYLGFTLLALWTAELVVKMTIAHLRGRIERGQPAI